MSTTTADAPVDIFGTEVWSGSAWQIQGAVLRIEGAEDLIVTSANLTYNRSIQKFTPINQNRRFLFTGQPDGGLSLGLIVGPDKGLNAFITRFADPCSLNQNVIQLVPSGIVKCSSESGEPNMFTLHGCLIASLGIQVQQGGNGMSFVNGGLNLQFLYMDMTE